MRTDDEADAVLIQAAVERVPARLKDDPDDLESIRRDEPNEGAQRVLDEEFAAPEVQAAAARASALWLIEQILEEAVTEGSALKTPGSCGREPLTGQLRSAYYGRRRG